MADDRDARPFGRDRRGRWRGSGAGPRSASPRSERARTCRGAGRDRRSGPPPRCGACENGRRSREPCGRSCPERTGRDTRARAPRRESRPRRRRRATAGRPRTLEPWTRRRGERDPDWLLAPTETSAPRSTVRFVIVPANGASTRANAFISCRRWRFASPAAMSALATSTPAWVVSRNAVFSATSCFVTPPCPTRPWYRSSVESASAALADALTSLAWSCFSVALAWLISWSSSGVSISARSWPSVTSSPMSTCHFFR